MNHRIWEVRERSSQTQIYSQSQLKYQREDQSILISLFWQFGGKYYTQFKTKFETRVNETAHNEQLACCSQPPTRQSSLPVSAASKVWLFNFNNHASPNIDYNLFEMIDEEESENDNHTPNQVDFHYHRFKRFELDLEFIQLLGDPGYVRHLVASGYLRQEEFLKYLKYLMYFKKPEYLIYVKYPEGLKYLELLQQPDFVKLIELAPFQWNMHRFSPFTRQLALEGYLHSKYMWNPKNLKDV